jgi:hypothetical protein
VVVWHVVQFICECFISGVSVCYLVTSELTVTLT